MIQQESTEHQLTCIVCPMGCHLKIKTDDQNQLQVEGAGCPRGKVFAKNELTAPMRMVTSVVHLVNSNNRCLPVISCQPVPRDKLKECVHLLKQVTCQAPKQMGEVIVKDILGTGVDIIAAKTADIKPKGGNL